MDRLAKRHVYLALNDPEAQGGVQTVVTTLAQGFRESGYLVTIVGIRRPHHPSQSTEKTEAYFYPFPNLALPNILKKAVNRGGMRLERLSLYGHWIFVRRFTRQLKANPGHIIAMDVFIAELISKISKPNGPSRLVQFHNSFDAIDGTRDLLRLIRMSPSYDQFLALSPEDARKFTTVLDKVAIAMPNPLPFTSHLRTGQRQKRVISVGRLVPHKGFGVLVQAWAALEPSLRADWDLCIVGDGPERVRIEAKITKLGLEASVSLVGDSDDVQTLLADSEVMALASEYEGFGMVLLEAMSQSTACIATDSGPGPRDLIERSQGILVPVGNIAELTKALTRMITDKEIRERSANGGYQLSKDFEITGIIKRWEMLLAQ